MKESLDALLETANEAAPDWKEDILGYVEEDLYTAADGDLAAAGVTDEEERGAVKAVVAMKALYLAYRESLEGLDDADAQAYIRAAIEGTPLPGPKLAAVPPPAPLPGPKPAGFKAPVLK